MNLVEAINKVALGYEIVSNTGIHYTPEQLSPKWYGTHYASFRSSGMTEIERKGNFEIQNYKI